MAGSFSGHLIDSFLAAHTPRGPFGQSSPQISTHGSLAFSPSMHGTFTQQSNSSMIMDPSFMALSEETAVKLATLQAKLDKKLGPEFISQRPGPGGTMKLTYAEGWKIINLANEVFGFNGWSSNVVSLVTDFIDFNEETKRYTVGVTAVIRVTLRDGVFHEDVGYGMLENSKSKGAALDKCKKEAVTDGVKRALRNFGNLLGNCLYDKSYTQEVVKIKVQPPKFNKDELYRRPEYDPNATPSQPSTSVSSTSAPPNIKAKSKQDAMHPPPPKPISSVPPHMRSVTGLAAMSTPVKVEPVAGPSRHVTPANPKAPSTDTGLNTPIQTPVHLQVPSSRLNDVRPNSTSNPPPQAALAAEQGKHVSFAPPVKPPQAPSRSGSYSGDDESFGLNSEDDAFFAGIDLGEGEVAAEDPDESLGGPIDFDEGLGGVDVSVETERLPSPPRVLLHPAQHQSHTHPRQQQQQQQRQPQQNRPANSEFQHQRQTVVAPQPQQNQRTLQPAQRQQTTGLADASNQNLSDSGQGNAKQEPPSQRSLTASMGGFHFPPGPGARNQPPAKPLSNPCPRPVQAQTSSTGIGLKRNADTMQAQSIVTTSRRPAQGMGLAHHTPSTTSFNSSTTGGGWSASVRREPLSTISADVPDGGDPKKMRR